MATGAQGPGGFAELVRGLKERSGLSYGALAKKLHVSTSTLHRYCNGDAVPTEFASVERLARLCGASREEVIRLHRSWILADEGRKRGKAAPSVVAPEPEAEAGAEAGPGPEAQPEPGPGAEAVREPEYGPEAEAERRPEPGPEVEPELAAVEPAKGEEAPPAPEAAPEAAVDVVTVQSLNRPPATGTSRSRKRLGMALAAAAVVVLAVPVAYAVRGWEGTGGGDGGAVAGPAAEADGTLTSTPSASGSGSAAPSASVPASTTPSAAPPSSAAKESSAAAPREKTGTPVSVGISSYNWAGACGQFYALDRRPEEVPSPPTPQDSRVWARALGGVDGGSMQLQLTVTGRTDEAVVLSALRVRVVERGTPLNRSVYAMGDGCGSGLTPQTFDIDLDAPRPFAKPVAGIDGDGVVPAKDFPYKVSTSDPQVLNLSVHTEEYVAAWYLELEWSSGERRDRVRIDDGGQPFRTSAIEGKKVYGYRPDEGVWAAP
ncbi:helix-turn-helix domain-containing protein [Streptomyces sp. NPDC059875]|uniref:helix-turn-helix domain-containing protein n=1 Tax=unclassified Streptomyces TaxID=2593676 RepID=UPI00366993D7